MLIKAKIMWGKFREGSFQHRTIIF